MPDIVPAWMWKDPYEIIDRLMSLHPGALFTEVWIDGERAPLRRVLTLPPGAQRFDRDRYYTQARRFHVKQIMTKRGIAR